MLALALLLACTPDPVYVDVSVNLDGFCAITDEGALECQGTPAPAYPENLSVAAVDLAYHGGCVLLSDGQIACDAGEDGTPVFPNGADYTQISVARSAACGLSRAGELVMAYEDGTFEEGLPAGPFTEVACGAGFLVATDEAEAATAWIDLPYMPAPPDTAHTHVDAGYWDACSITPEGEVQCWGQSETDPDPSLQPWADVWPTNWQKPEGSDFVQVEVGHAGHACGLRSDGSITCWGSLETDPLDPWTGDTVFTDISVDGDSLCAVTDLGEVWCTGHVVWPVED